MIASREEKGQALLEGLSAINLEEKDMGTKFAVSALMSISRDAKSALEAIGADDKGDLTADLEAIAYGLSVAVFRMDTKDNDLKKISKKLKEASEMLNDYNVKNGFDNEDGGEA